MQTILGAGGAIGIELAKDLVNYTKAIRLVSRHPEKINETDEVVAADLTQPQQVKNAVIGSEVVYLTAGLPYNIKIWQKNWPLIMRNVIDACKENNARLVFFDNVYMIGGDNVNHITEESPISPVSKKGNVRTMLNQMIFDEMEKGKLKSIIARSADFYGPYGDTSMLMELVYKNLEKGKKAQWLCNAKVVHSFTYTADAAKGTALLGNTPGAYNQVWNLPTNPSRITGEQWISLFAKETGGKEKYQVIPKWPISFLGLFNSIMRELPEMCYQYDRDYYFDSSKFNKRFQYKPITPEEGVKQTVRILSKK